MQDAIEHGRGGRVHFSRNGVQNRPNPIPSQFKTSNSFPASFHSTYPVSAANSTNPRPAVRVPARSAPPDLPNEPKKPFPCNKIVRKEPRNEPKTAPAGPHIRAPRATNRLAPTKEPLSPQFKTLISPADASLLQYSARGSHSCTMALLRDPRSPSLLHRPFGRTGTRRSGFPFHFDQGLSLMKDRLVVVGNGMAGVACVEQILRHSPDFHITIFG